MHVFEQSILHHAMVGRRLSKAESLVDKVIQHLPYLGSSISNRRRSSAFENAKVGEDNVKVVVDSAIGSPPASLTEHPAQNSAPKLSTISKADALGARKSSSADGTGEIPSTVATTPSAMDYVAPTSAISMADSLGSSGPVDASTVCESPSAPLTSPRRHSRRSSLRALIPKVFRSGSPTSCNSPQHDRIPDTPPTLELNSMALEELWGCPEYFFKQQMPSSGVDPTCRHHEDRSSMDEIFHLELEETTPEPVELEGTPLLPAYSSLSIPGDPEQIDGDNFSDSLSIHGDPEQIERDTFIDPFHSDGEEEGDDGEGSTEAPQHAYDSSYVDPDSDSTSGGPSLEWSDRYKHAYKEGDTVFEP